MRTHRLDVLSLVFGLLFVVLALAALADAFWLSITDLRWVLPSVFVALGLALVVSSMRRATPSDVAEQTARMPRGTPDESPHTDDVAVPGDASSDRSPDGSALPESGDVVDDSDPR